MPVPAEELWADVVGVCRYATWWPWIRTTGATELDEGSRVSVSIPSPLGYRVRIVLAPTEVVAKERLEAEVSGDLRGGGSLALRADGDGRTRLELSWDVEVARPLLRVLGWVVRPLLEWGHRRVVRKAISDYLRRR